jgi:outer membrane protein assembly factor BamA
MQSLTVLIAVALIVSDPARGDEAGVPEATPVVQSIEWRGNDAISERELRAHILTQASRWPRFWITYPFHESDLEADMDRIAALYRLRGYYETAAEYSLVFDASHSKVTIEIRIDDGAPVRTKTVRVRFSDGSPPTLHPLVEPKEWEALVVSLPLRRDEIFELEHYRNSGDKILAYFAELGFPEAQLTGGTEVDLAQHAVSVAWTLELGRRVHLGEAQIFGLESVDEFIVRREISFEPGAWYSISELTKTRRRLQNLGLFRWTTVEAERPDASAATKLEATGLASEPAETEGDVQPGVREDETVWPVEIRLSERPPRRIRVGGGWGTDTSFRGELAWHHRNFFGGARQADFALRYSGLVTSVRPTFIEPYFLGTRTGLLVTPALLYENQDAYKARRILADVQLRRELTPPWSIRAGFHFDRSDVFSVLDDPGEDDLPEGVTINTGPYLAVRRSTVANPLNARSGTTLDLAAETSISAFGSDEDFIRYTLDARSFVEIWSTVLAARLLLGTIQNVSNTDAEDISLVERFYSGGSGSMRGVGYRSLSPKDAAGDSIGGSSLIEASVEWRVALFRNLGAVAFIDAAFVGPDPFRWELDKLRYAAGPGLRYHTPAGPIRLDFAWRLNPERRRGKFRLNASLGHTF